jgi:hypothetical protein
MMLARLTVSGIFVSEHSFHQSLMKSGEPSVLGHLTTGECKGKAIFRLIGARLAVPSPTDRLKLRCDIFLLTV